MAVTISTTISEHLHDLGKQHHISWAEALRIGMSIMLSEKGIIEYDNRINIIRKLQFFSERADELQNAINDLNFKLRKYEPTS